MVIASRMRSTAAAFTGLPANAPSRSTTWQILEALRLERLRLRRRIAVEHGRARHVALLEPHADAVLEVDGGEQDHDYTPVRQRVCRGRTIARQTSRLPLQEIGDQRKPRRWLFSGWNWVPTMVSRPTMAVTGPP